MNAMFTNRIGDYFLTIGIFAIFFTFGTLDYATIFSLAPYINVNVMTLIALLLLLGAAAKSAQLGYMKAYKNINYLYFYVILKYAERYIITLEEIKNDYKSYNKVINENNNQQEVDILDNIGKYPEGYKREFLEWFIGFTEGDGSFHIVKGKYLREGRGKCFFTIHLHMSDLNLLYLIKKELNMGIVYLHNKSNSAYFRVEANKDILRLIEIFNGNLYLRKKQTQFENWVINHNERYKLNIIIKPYQFYPTLKDNWLAGFIDAEGCFIVSVAEKKRKIMQRIVIEQKDSEQEFLYISNLIQGYTEKRIRYDRIVVNYLKCNIIIDYLMKFKLRSTKFKSFEKWMEIYVLRKNKKKGTKIDIDYVKKEAKFINKTRKKDV
jgi:LAGLIDADG endonuclease